MSSGPIADPLDPEDRRIHTLYSNTRGSLIESNRRHAVFFHSYTWLVASMAAFLLPLACLIGVCNAIGLKLVLECLNIGSLIYLVFYTSFVTLVSATILFPCTFRYKNIRNVFTRRKHHRHRAHWSNITQRRWRQYLRPNDKPTVFSIFLLGLLSRTIALSVTRSTTISDIESTLIERAYLRSTSSSHYFETVAAFPQRLKSFVTVSNAGIHPNSHIRIIFPVKGGFPNEESLADDPATSSRRSVRDRDTTRYDAAIQEEVANASDERSGGKKATGRKRRRQAKKNISYAGQDADEGSDEAFEDSDSGSGAESSDSEKGLAVTNNELVDSLPALTIPAGTSRKGKEKAATSQKKRKTNDAVPTRDDEEDVSTTTASQAPVTKQPKRTNPIYLFYKEVESDGSGTIEPGTKYFQCLHGNKKVVKITAAMKGNLNNLTGHLQRTFPAYYRLYEVLQKRKTPPTAEEVAIASGQKRLDEAMAQKYLAELDTISQDIQVMLAKQAEQAKEPWDQNHFEDLVAKWVAACDQPFTAVDDPEFREMLEYVHRQSGRKLVIPHDRSVKRRITSMHKDMIEGFKAAFKENTSNFALSLDAWTLSNGYAFMAIVIHYISNTGQLEECLIDFQEIMGEHSGENMAKIVWNTIELYELKGRIISFVMDNATNNDTLVEHFAALCEKEGIKFSVKDRRMRCLPHVLHLSALKLLEMIGAVSKDVTKTSAYQEVAAESSSSEHDADAVDLVDEVDDAEEDPEMSSINSSSMIKHAVSKLRKIVRSIRSSPQQRQTYLREVKSILEDREVEAARVQSRQPKFTGIVEKAVMVILDVKTRWSSTHQMLRRALGYQDAINAWVSKDRTMRDYELLSADWEALALVAEWLKSFRDATRQMSQTRRSMISSTHAIFRGLQEELQGILRKLPNHIDPALKQGLLDAHRKLSDYFYKFSESQYYTWAALLDPRISYEGLKEDYASDFDLTTILDDSKSALEDHYHSNYHSQPESSTSASLPASIDNMRSPQKCFTSRYSKKRVSSDAKDELKEYFRLTSIPEPFDTTDPIAWWHMRRQQFPNLFRLVRDILCIPGSAVAVERVFSGGRDTIGIRRSRLTAESIRTLMLLKARLRLERKAVIDLVGDQ